MRQSLFLSALALALTVTGPATAQPPTAQPPTAQPSTAQPSTAPDSSAAREAFAEGRDHFDDRRYVLAAESFQRAYDLMMAAGLPNAWVILYNIGTSLDEIRGREQDARDAYAAYLERVPAPADEEARVRLTRVQARIRELDLRIEAASRGAPAALPVEPPPVEPPPVVAREPETSISPIGPIVLGAGGALLVGAAITGAVLAAENDAFLSMCSGDVCPTSARESAEGVQQLAIATDVLWISGAALAATGLVLTLLLRDTVSEDAPTVAAGCGTTGCVVQLGVAL